MNKPFFTFLFWCGTLTVFAQDLSQIIRGMVLDKDSQIPLIGATVQLMGMEKGTTIGNYGFKANLGVLGLAWKRQVIGIQPLACQTVKKILRLIW